MDYYPDHWVIVKISPLTRPGIYKVLAGWRGGYTEADEWRLNSGIERYEIAPEGIVFYGHSGSAYYCHHESERTSALTQSVFERFSEQAKQWDGTELSIVPFDEFREQFSNGGPQ